MFVITEQATVEGSRGGTEACAHGHFMLAMVSGFSNYGRERHEDDLAHSHTLMALRLGFGPAGAMECFVALTAAVRASADGSGALSMETVERVVTASGQHFSSILRTSSFK